MDQTNTELLNFILSGKATFTVTSAKSGGRYTYKVIQVQDRKPEQGPAWFVSVLSGPDNTRDFDYMGLLTDTGPEPCVYTFRATRGSKVGMGAPSFRGFAWLLRRLQTCGLGEAAIVDHMGRCGRCGRALTVPESIRTGLGPECAKRAAA